MNRSMQTSQTNRPISSVSLRKSLLWLVLICLGPALGLVGFLAVENYRLFRAQIQSETKRLAEVFVADIDRELAAIESGLQVLATSEELTHGDLGQFHKIAKQAVKSQIVYNYILTNPQGHQVVNTLIPFGQELPKKGTPPQLARVFTENRTILTDYFIGPVTGKGAIAMGVPVLNPEGEVHYSLNIGLAPEKISELLKKRVLAEGWLAAVIDTSGTIVGRTRDETKFTGSKAVTELRNQIATHRNGTMDSFTKEGIPVSSAFASSDKWGWSVITGAPKAIVEEQLKKSVMYAALIALIIMFFAGWVGLKIVRHLTQSVQVLNQAALEIMKGKPVELPKVRLVEAQAIGQAIVKASELTSEIHFLAYHDTLTHLANRHLFYEFLENSFARARRSAEDFSLLALDLDNFKTVNDRDGHAAGDALLKEVAKRITDEIRTEDLAARIGGDEFAILLMNTGAEAAMEVASRLCSSLSKPFAASHVDVSASLGVVSWQPGIMDVKVIMELADQALYRAKEKGKKTIMQAKT